MRAAAILMARTREADSTKDEYANHNALLVHLRVTAEKRRQKVYKVAVERRALHVVQQKLDGGEAKDADCGSLLDFDDFDAAAVAAGIEDDEENEGVPAVAAPAVAAPAVADGKQEEEDEEETEGEATEDADFCKLEEDVEALAPSSLGDLFFAVGPDDAELEMAQQEARETAGDKVEEQEVAALEAEFELCAKTARETVQNGVDNMAKKDAKAAIRRTRPDGMTATGLLAQLPREQCTTANGKVALAAMVPTFNAQVGGLLAGTVEASAMSAHPQRAAFWQQLRDGTRAAMVDEAGIHVRNARIMADDRAAKVMKQWLSPQVLNTADERAEALRRFGALRSGPLRFSRLVHGDADLPRMRFPGFGEDFAHSALKIAADNYFTVLDGPMPTRPPSGTSPFDPLPEKTVVLTAKEYEEYSRLKAQASAGAADNASAATSTPPGAAAVSDDSDDEDALRSALARC